MSIFVLSSILIKMGGGHTVPTALQRIGVASHEQNPGNSHPRVDEVSGDTVFLRLY